MEDDEVKTPSPLVRRIIKGLSNAGIRESEARKAIMEATGASKQNMTHWFNGTTKYPSVQHICALSETYNMDLHWILMGDKEPPSIPGQSGMKVGNIETAHFHNSPQPSSG